MKTSTELEVLSENKENMRRSPLKDVQKNCGIQKLQKTAKKAKNTAAGSTKKSVAAAELSKKRTRIAARRSRRLMQQIFTSTPSNTSCEEDTKTLDLPLSPAPVTVEVNPNVPFMSPVGKKQLVAPDALPPSPWSHRVVELTKKTMEQDETISALRGELSDVSEKVSDNTLELEAQMQKYKQEYEQLRFCNETLVQKMAEMRGKFIKHLQTVHKDHDLESKDVVAKHQAEVNKWKNMLEVTVNQVKAQLMGGLSASVEKIEALKKSLEQQKALNERLVARLTQLGVDVDGLSDDSPSEQKNEHTMSEQTAAVVAEPTAEEESPIDMDNTSDEIEEEEEQQ